MGGGQAGAPADDDHVSWTRPPPGVATVPAGGLGAGLPVRPGRPNLRDRNGLTPGSGPRGQWEGSGSERLVGGSGGADKSATQSQRQLAIDKANV